MQADKWGAAGSVADGVRSNVTLGVDSRAPQPQTRVSRLATIFPPCVETTEPNAPKNCHSAKRGGLVRINDFSYAA